MSQPLLLEGKSVAEAIEKDLAARVARIKERSGRTPVLATILVGSDPASATYVRMKGNACRRVGMESLAVPLSEATTTEELLARIDALNADASVNGILLQHPMPRAIDERACFDRIAIEKDVDGVTALGFGRMSLGERAYGSATPAGIMRLLDHYQVAIEGKHAVVVGRSPILGKPMAMMLLNRHATVTICHSRTKDLPQIVRQAEIVVAAVGRPRFVQGGLDQGRGGDRRRRLPPGEGGRRGPRRGGAAIERLHARPGRRRADDDRDAHHPDRRGGRESVRRSVPRIEHVALWVRDLERMRAFYETHLGGRSGPLYRNEQTGYRSYFVSFGDGPRLELMTRDAARRGSSGRPESRPAAGPTSPCASAVATTSMRSRGRSSPPASRSRARHARPATATTRRSCSIPKATASRSSRARGPRPRAPRGRRSCGRRAA